MWLKKFLSFVRSFRIIPVVAEIQKLHVKRNEFLVFKISDDEYSLQNAEELFSSIKEIFGNINTVFMYGNIEIYVVSKEESVRCDDRELGA